MEVSGRMPEGHRGAGVRVVRRSPPITLGDFVSHPTKGTGVVNATVRVGPTYCVVLSWDGRGTRPTFASARKFNAYASELQKAEVPVVKVLRRR